MRTWSDIPHRFRMMSLRMALREIMEPSTSPESGHCENKPEWWDSFWSGFFAGANYQEWLKQDEYADTLKEPNP